MQAARGASLRPSPRRRKAGPVSRRGPLLLLGAIALVAYLVDVATKVLAVERLGDGRSVPVLGSWLMLDLTRNPGAAFSTGSSYTVVFSVVAVVAACVVVWVARRVTSTGWAVALGFLLAGILGNLTDRVFRDPSPFHGYVVDFLALPNFPVFNFADVWINVAAALVIIQSIRGVGLAGRPVGDEHED